MRPRPSNGASSARRWLRPFSRTHTERPASVSTSAAVAPPGPDPMTTTSNSGTRDLRVRPSAGLHVARVSDHAPPRELVVAAVLGCAVRRLARVLEEQVLQFRVRVKIEVVEVDPG